MEQKLSHTLSIVNYLALWLSIGGLFLVRTFFLRSVNLDRKRVVGKHLKRTVQVGIFSTICFVIYLFSRRGIPLPSGAEEFRSIGLFFIFLTFIFWGLTLVRALSFIFAFWINPKVPVPLLLINVFTISCSAVILIVVATEILNISLGPLLATSAIVSVVLGLALQETLGNLFSGIAMQFDKPYKIGDWVEIFYNGNKTVGQVVEISWRASVLKAMTDENIIVPNRVVAQAVVHNFCPTEGVILRGVNFRVPFGFSFENLHLTLSQRVIRIPNVAIYPPPKLLMLENGDGFHLVRLIYFVTNYGEYALTSSEVLVVINAVLKDLGIELPFASVMVHHQNKGMEHIKGLG